MRAIFLLALAPALLAQTPSAFETHLTAAQTALSQSRYAEANQQLHAAVAELANPDPARPPARVMEAYANLSDLDLLLGRADEGIEAARQALATAEATFGPSSTDISPHLMRLAGALRVGRKTSDSVPVLERMLTIDLTLGPDDPKVSTDYDKLGSAYLELTRYEDARTAYRNALQTRISRLGPDHLDVATSWVNLGVLEDRNERPVDAKTDFETALAISEAKLGPEAYGLTGILDRLGALHSSHGKDPQWKNGFANAEVYLQRSLAIREKVLGARHSDVAPALENLGWVYFFDSKYLEAEPLFQQALQILMATKDADSPLIAEALDAIGTTYSAQKRYPEAEPYFKKALAIRETKTIESLTSLGQLYATIDDLKRSGDYFERASLIGQKGLGGDHPEIITTLESYAVMLRMANRIADARKVEAQVKELKEKWPSKDVGTVVASAGPAGATGSTGATGGTGPLPQRTR
ncbi:MAG TPA: tetratricopeptide repeat protein [Bryobacteraceae bacterium]|nr:tetratricopeptide repeat protein [Bryobacteraceae bacterium]